MNLREMVARVMRSLKSIPPGTVGYTDIVDILNQGQRQLAVHSNKICVFETTLEGNKDIIALPTDLLKLYSVYWKSPNGMRELSPARGKLPIDTVVESRAEPINYYVKDGTVIVRPIPGFEGTLSVSYVPKPTEMVNDSDEPDLEGSEEYLVAFTLHRIFIEHGNPLAQVWEVEMTREQVNYIATTDQNYMTPFQSEISW